MTKTTHYYLKDIFTPRIHRGDEIGESEVKEGCIYACQYRVKESKAQSLGISKYQWGVVKILPEGKAIGYNLKGNYGKITMTETEIGKCWHLFRATEQEVAMMDVVCQWMEAYNSERKTKFERDVALEEKEYLKKWVVELKKHHKVERLIFCIIFVVSLVAVAVLSSCGGHPQTKILPELHEEEMLEVMPPEGNPEDFDSCYWDSIMVDYSEQMKLYNDGYETE